MKAKICDNCKKVFREEGKWCKNEEIEFTYKYYHFGEGMQFPWKNKEGVFCSRKCFEKWYKIRFDKWLEKEELKNKKTK